MKKKYGGIRVTPPFPCSGCHVWSPPKKKNPVHAYGGGEADFELALVRCLPAWLKPLCRQLSLERMEKASRADD